MKTVQWIHKVAHFLEYTFVDYPSLNYDCFVADRFIHSLKPILFDFVRFILICSGTLI